MSTDEKTAEERAAELKKKRTFKKFSFRGVELEKLLELSRKRGPDMLNARQRGGVLPRCAPPLQ